MTSQILKFLNFTKKQKFRYLENEKYKIMRIAITIKNDFIAKNSFTVEVTFKNRSKVKSKTKQKQKQAKNNPKG